MHFEVLVNCGAGSIDDEAADRQVAEIEEAFAASGAEAKVHMFDPRYMEAEVLDVWSRGPDAVVVAGGDGTIGSAAGVAAGTDIVLGVLPLGTFNHFARDLGMPTELAAAALALAAGAVRAVDVGEVDGRVFVNNSVLGAYPLMVDVRDDLRDQRGWGKVRAVPVAALHVLRRLPTHRLTIATPDAASARKVRTPFVFIGNGPYENGTGGIGERSSIESGRLWVYVARVASRWGLVRTMARALVRGAQSAALLEQLECQEVEVRARVGHLRVALDGEVVSLPTPLRYRSRPGALHVLAPADPG